MKYYRVHKSIAFFYRVMRQTTERLTHRWCCQFGLLFLILSASTPVLATPGALIVGVTELPPYSIKTDDGDWQGLGVDLWRRAAEVMAVTYEFREYERTKQIAQAIINGNVDVTCQMAVTEANETVMDLSHAYHRTGMGIVVAMKSWGIQWLDYARHISYGSIVAVIVVLLGLSLVAGTIIWLLEKKTNPEMFGREVNSGIGHGLWWALVTMTTVGYGDKAPRTPGGRAAAVVWMFLSVSCIASYTAIITSSITVGELRSRIDGLQDLPRVRVGVLSRSETKEVMEEKGIAVLPFEDLMAGMQAVVDERIDAFVDNEAQLIYLVRNHFPGHLMVLSQTFEHHYVSMGLQAGSALRETLNRTIAKILVKDEWKMLRRRYMGIIE